MAENYDGSIYDPVITIDSESALPSRGPELKGGDDINNIDNLIEVYLR